MGNKASKAKGGGINKRGDGASSSSSSTPPPSISSANSRARGIFSSYLATNTKNLTPPPSPPSLCVASQIKDLIITDAFIDTDVVVAGEYLPRAVVEPYFEPERVVRQVVEVEVERKSSSASLSLRHVLVVCLIAVLAGYFYGRRNAPHTSPLAVLYADEEVAKEDFALFAGRDGKMSPQEFVAYLKAKELITKHLDKNKVSNMFNKHDADGSTVLDASEFRGAVEAVVAVNHTHQAHGHVIGQLHEYSLSSSNSSSSSGRGGGGNGVGGDVGDSSINNSFFFLFFQRIKWILWYCSFIMISLLVHRFNTISTYHPKNKSLVDQFLFVLSVIALFVLGLLAELLSHGSFEVQVGVFALSVFVVTASLWDLYRHWLA